METRLFPASFTASIGVEQEEIFVVEVVVVVAKEEEVNDEDRMLELALVDREPVEKGGKGNCEKDGESLKENRWKEED